MGVLTGSPCCYADQDLGTGMETPAQRDARMKWWREAKFGMFIHWNIVDATPFKRDVVKELSEACQKHGLRFGLYYSHAMDWNNPGAAVPGDCWDNRQRGDMDDYLRKTSIPQLEEILTKYGKISVLWFDTSYDMDRRRADMVRSVLKLQPGIIINDTWGYKITDQNWKSRKVLLEQLVDLASQGGNYLLNVGPNPEGEIPAPAVKRLKQVGAWTKLNGEAIFGATASPFTKQLPWGRCTKKVDDAGATLYFHVFQWPADGKLVVPGLKSQIETAYLLADPDKKSLKTANNTADVTVNVPAAAPDKDISVVVVRVKGKVEIAGRP